MARRARVLSNINSYTIMLKANDNVVFNEHDLSLFLETTEKYSSILNYKLLAYSLNSSMLTFVLYDCDSPLETIMRKICVSFVSKFNIYHIRHGKVFKDRYLSVPATNIKHVWDMVYDVHLIKDFCLNSKQNYFKNQYINVACAKQFFGSEQNFISAVINRSSDGTPLALNKTLATKKMLDNELKDFIIEQFNITPSELASLPKSKLIEVLVSLVNITKASARQIARVTNLPLRLLWSITKSSSGVEENNE